MNTWTLLKSFRVFILTNNEWIQLAVAAVLLLLAVFGSKVVRKLTGLLHDRLARFTPRWLLILNEGFVEPIILLIRTALIYLAVLALPLPWSIYKVNQAVSPFFASACAILRAGGFWRSEELCTLLLISARNQLDMEKNQTLVHFLEKIYRVLVVLFGAFAVLEIFGVPVAGLLAGAGVVGLAISLAAQSTLSSFIAGITLVVERPFGIGDYVILGSVEGTVEEVSFRSTRLRTPDKVLITIENSQVCSEYIQNITDRSTRLWTFTVGVKYDTPPERIEKLRDDLTAMFQADPQVVPDMVNVVLKEFSSSSIDLDARIYVTAVDLGEYRELQNRINLKIMNVMRQDGCEFAYPSTSVYLEPMS
ncbi:MAG: mechanosensitive ion channel family protein [Lachnospiraceae bacterium]|nr:mechanosensitive ion channel family protein [Lachnospiraceae bacterium]